jgi:PAS domain S-box-containing protein
MESSKPVTESVLASIISVSSDAVICTNPEQRVTFFNEGAAKMFGYSAREVMGKPLDMLMPARTVGAHAEHMRRFGRSPVAARRMGERQEIRGRRKNGEEFPAEAAIAHSDGPDGPVFSVVMRDVSERYRTEERQRLLMDSGQRLADSIELDETLDLVARVWVPRFAVAAVVDAAIGPTMSRTLCTIPTSPDTREAVFRDVPAPPLPLPEELRRSSAKVSGFSNAAVADFDESTREAVRALDPKVVVTLALVARSRVVGLLRIFRRDPLELEDLALAEAIALRAAMAIDNARMHDEVQRAVRMRDETISVVSHDLRNPVSAVKMLASALLRDDAGNAIPGDATGQLTVIFKAAEQMDALIQDLLDASRAESGRLPIDAAPMPAASLLRDAVATLEPIATDCGIALRAEIPHDLPAVLADPERITQVMSNLVGNAMKFSPAGATVIVRAAVDGSSLQVSVTDSGPGIPPEHRQRVFERYWQLNRSNGGSGLGLTIARGIVEAHGGRIWVDEDHHPGTTLRFTLPMPTV